MNLKQKVDAFLLENYAFIEDWRTKDTQFRWSLVASEIGEGLSSEYIRNRFRKIRIKNDDSVLEVKAPKRKLFIDIESSFNIVSSWRIGSKINLSHDNIIEEKKIICLSYSWDDSDKVQTLSWNSDGDAKLLLEFSKLLNEDVILVGHNSDGFDIPFIRTRCIYHGIPFPAKLQTIDTLKMARNSFSFNNNKLDYIAKFLGLGEKVSTGGLQLWNDVILKKDKEALKNMIDYCENDVIITKKVYQKLQDYCQIKKFRND
jgi:hypothetical protein